MKDTENSDVLARRASADINEAVDIPEEADGDAGVPREWHSRGYLPHRNSPQIIQAISYRLADSLPRQKLELLETELAQTFPWRSLSYGCVVHHAKPCARSD